MSWRMICDYKPGSDPENVLIAGVYPNGIQFVEESYWRKDIRGWAGRSLDKVTHWQPLEEPPDLSTISVDRRDSTQSFDMKYHEALDKHEEKFVRLDDSLDDEALQDRREAIDRLAEDGGYCKPVCAWRRWWALVRRGM